jgi:hypothetical protein
VGVIQSKRCMKELEKEMETEVGMMWPEAKEFK